MSSNSASNIGGAIANMVYQPRYLKSPEAPLIALLGALLVVILRLAYFYMAGAGLFTQGAYVNLEFVLIIFPLFVVFSIFALQAAAWLFTLSIADWSNGPRWFALFTLAFFIAFAVWTALFAGLGPAIGTTCGALIQPTVDTSARDALNLAFTITLVVLACFLLLLFVIAPYRLLLQVKDSGGLPWWTHVVGQVVIRVGPPMLGLVILAVLILVLSIRATTSEFFVFFMLIVGEVLPLLLMFYRLTKSQDGSTISSTRDSQFRSSDLQTRGQEMTSK